MDLRNDVDILHARVNPKIQGIAGGFHSPKDRIQFLHFPIRYIVIQFLLDTNQNMLSSPADLIVHFRQVTVADMCPHVHHKGEQRSRTGLGHYRAFVENSDSFQCIYLTDLFPVLLQGNRYSMAIRLSKLTLRLLSIIAPLRSFPICRLPPVSRFAYPHQYPRRKKDNPDGSRKVPRLPVLVVQVAHPPGRYCRRR